MCSAANSSPLSSFKRQKSRFFDECQHQQLPPSPSPSPPPSPQNSPATCSPSSPFRSPLKRTLTWSGSEEEDGGQEQEVCSWSALSSPAATPPAGFWGGGGGSPPACTDPALEPQQQGADLSAFEGAPHPSKRLCFDTPYAQAAQASNSTGYCCSNVVSWGGGWGVPPGSVVAAVAAAAGGGGPCGSVSGTLLGMKRQQGLWAGAGAEDPRMSGPLYKKQR